MCSPSTANDTVMRASSNGSQALFGSGLRWELPANLPDALHKLHQLTVLLVTHASPERLAQARVSSRLQLHMLPSAVDAACIQ